MKTPDQGALFGSLPLAAGVVHIVGSKTALRPEQRTFNRLIADIDKAKAELAQWRGVADSLVSQVETLMEPALREKSVVIRELVIGLDTLISTPQKPRLGKVQRERLLVLMTELMDMLGGPVDPVIDEIHVRHHGYGMVDENPPVHGAGADDAQERDDRQRAQEDAPEDPFHGEAPEWEPGPARARRGDGAGDGGSGKRAEQAREASQSLRDTYRRLASLLHPDREPDPVERERKNQLMQQANQAYEARDLLTLLNMQLELERFDPARLAALPSERVKHYNQILKEQLQSVRAEIGMVIEALDDMAFPDTFRQPRTPEAYRQRFLADLAVVRELTEHLRALAQGIQDPATQVAARAELLNLTRKRPRRPDVLDIAEMDPRLAAAIDDWLQENMEGPRRPRR